MLTPFTAGDPNMHTTTDQVVDVLATSAPADQPLAATKPRIPANSVLASARDEVAGIGLLIELALQHGRPIAELTDALKTILDLRARQQFAAAMHAFRAEVPPVPKAKWANMQGKNSAVAWGFSYAPLPVIDEHIKPYCEKHGLSYSWDQDRPVDGILATRCIVRHSGGHQETTTFYGAPTANDAISASQRIAATNSFNMRQALVMALGLSTTDNFDDEELLARMAAPPPAKPGVQSPGRRADAPPPATRPATQAHCLSAEPRPAQTAVRLASEKQCAMIKGRADRAGVAERDLERRFKLDSLDAIPSASVDAILEYISQAQPGMAE